MGELIHLNLDSVVEVSETGFEMLYINACRQNPALWEDYTHDMGVLDMYKIIGCRINYYHNTVTGGLNYVPREKSIGFKQNE